MAQTSVIFNAKDNLSGTIKSISTQLSDMDSKTAAAAAKTEQLRAKFSALDTSGKSIKQQLRQISMAMADMNAGVAQMDPGLYTEMATRAGELRDAIDDANQSVKVFASDTSGIDALMSGLQGITGMFAVAQGAEAMFGSENKKVAETLKKVQGAIALVNGVQAVANTLNKNSALVMKVKQVWLLATTASTTASTAATTGNTAAIVANTVASTALTVKQKIATAAEWAFNVATAVGKALLGDWTGLILVAAAGITTYALCTAQSTEAEEAANEVKKSAAEITKEKSDAEMEAAHKVTDAAAVQIAAYQNLQNQWNSLKSDQEKNQFLKDNKRAFENLGFSVTDVSDAEAFFTEQTPAIIAALKARAAAAAAYNNYVEALQRQLALEGQDTLHFTYDPDKAGDYEKQLEAARQRLRQQVHDSRADSERMWQMVVQKQREAEAAISTLERFKPREHQHTTDSSSSSGGTRGSRDNKPEEGSQAWYEAERDRYAQILKSQELTEEQRAKVVAAYKAMAQAALDLKNANEQAMALPAVFNDDSVKGLKDHIAAINAELQNQTLTQDEIRAKLIERLALESKLKELESQQSAILSTLATPTFDDTNIKGLKDHIGAINTQLQNQALTQEQVNDLVRQRLALEKQIADIQGMQVTAERASLTPIEQKRAEVEELLSQLKSGQLVGDAFEQAATRVSQLQGEINTFDFNLSEKVKTDAERQKEAYDQMVQNQQSVVGAVDNLGNVFGSLGDIVGENTGDMLKWAGQCINSIAQVLPQILSLITAKKAEGIAGATASGSSLPFPANLVAIAAGVAAVVAQFAAIPKFATGGIVGGSSYGGDRLLARVNSGEMILNGRQQARLFDAINSGQLGQTISFRLEGSDIVGAINNYNRKNSKYN